MFAAIIHRAQAAVDTAVDGLINRAIIAVPFLIAGGFATAALYLRLTREYGPETANLILAGSFAVLGLLCFALVGRTSKPSSEQSPAEQDTSNATAAEQSDSPSSSAPMPDVDRELMMAALTSAAPIALPGLIKLVLRNLPLVIAIISALFVLTRTPEEAATADVAAP